eukprot:7121994-Prymnesium_polylepis.1
MFVDVDFQASSDWVRFDELWPGESLPPSLSAVSEADAVRQGALGDCWLLAPLIALAHQQPDRVRALFEACSDADLRAGRAMLRLFVDGEWRDVVIDTLLPCDDQRRPLYCGRAGAGWPALVEKAFAKLRGSYAGLEGGRSVEAL